MTNNDIARKIIADNIYMCLATMGNKPWIATIRYSLDDTYTFFFASKRDTEHIAHIMKNDSSACAIFDSHQEDGTGQGIQMQGHTTLVKGKELDAIVKKLWPDDIENKRKNFTGDSIYRMYKFVPEHVFILDPNDITEDRRVEVTL